MFSIGEESNINCMPKTGGLSIPRSTADEVAKKHVKVREARLIVRLQQISDLIGLCSIGSTVHKA